MTKNLKIKKLYNPINVDLGNHQIFRMEEAELLDGWRAVVYGKLKENILEPGRKAKCLVVFEWPIQKVQDVTEAMWHGFYDVEVLE